MKILVVGAGATGGCFGARLAAAGRDVTFLVRPARATALRAGGLVVRGPLGDLVLRPHLVTSAARPYDLVLLAVKAVTLDRTVVDLTPAIGADTVILPMLNGMRHLDTLAERFGADRVLGGVCQVTTTLTPDGEILQLNTRQELAYGPAFQPGPNRLAAVDAALRGAGFTARTSPDIRQEMWDKWFHVSALGAITCLMRGVVGEVVAAGGAEVAERIVLEAAATAAAAGYPVSASVFDRTLATLTEPGSRTASSLYRDLTKGLPTEADHLIGDLIAHAARHGVDTTLLRLAHTHLSVHEHRLSDPIAAATTDRRLPDGPPLVR
ncbi:ketopantoate reductase [Amycolatopsis sulphurea]|uniref:2-dehydropantoate 2-reductase n=1 Tax=Amycolatopsis sulphurea TaxID=76022 RepID=A0A2A9FF78_9PSEU|nr:ketopantoate reductase family protein [Amycolatopsis sulphurea]PFG49160.1 ketopantoate reductase [Amycolatopsis sulphurea]